MFGFARRRRFLDYDYVPLVVPRDVRDVVENEDDDMYEDDAEVLASASGDEAESISAVPEIEALDAADDRERIAIPAV
jgi:hypothetical protein